MFREWAGEVEVVPSMKGPSCNNRNDIGLAPNWPLEKVGHATGSEFSWDKKNGPMSSYMGDTASSWARRAFFVGLEYNSDGKGEGKGDEGESEGRG